MEPIGWATQIELIRHGAPYSGLRPDARSCMPMCVRGLRVATAMSVAMVSSLYS